MSTYVWCEGSGSGYAFWNTVFKIMYPEFIVETKNSNTRLNKAIRQIRGCLKNSDVWKNAQKLLYVRRESAGRLSPDKDFRRHRQ